MANGQPRERIGSVISRATTVIDGRVVTERTEETLLGEDGLLGEVVIETLTACEGCGKAIHSREEAGGICAVGGHLACSECCQFTCQGCGRKACRSHRETHEQAALCAFCVRRDFRVGLAALALVLLLLGLAAFFVRGIF